MKPVFLHWAHKEMWGIIADFPSLGKEKAIFLLRKKYPEKIFSEVNHNCFACDSHNALNSGGKYKYQLKCPEGCPLAWGENAKMSSRVSCVSAVSPYTSWREAFTNEEWERASKYARLVRDVPLSAGAHDLFTVKESPFE